MNVFRWLAEHFSDRGKALLLYKRGMIKARKRDNDGAIHDYTETIGMSGTPADVRAMVLYNRALVYMSVGEEGKGTEDLETVLAMEETLVNVKTMARQKLAKMASRSGRKNG